MAAADDSPDAAVFVSLDPIRPLLMPVVAMGAGQLPPQFAELTRVPTLTNSIEIRVSCMPASRAGRSSWIWGPTIKKPPSNCSECSSKVLKTARRCS